MATIRATASMLVREIFRPSLSPGPIRIFPTSPSSPTARLFRRRISYYAVHCAASDSADGGKRAPARLSQVQQLMLEAEERAASAGNEPIPKITLGQRHITVHLFLMEAQRHTKGAVKEHEACASNTCWV